MPAFTVNLQAGHAGHVPYAGSSKLKVQADKGGELGNGIEDLLEDLIPRFTEIMEPTPSHLQDAEPPSASFTGVLDTTSLATPDHVLEKVSSTSAVPMRGNHSVVNWRLTSFLHDHVDATKLL